ncbi:MULTISPECIES: Gfo/Idh/MocA family protein [Rhizobium/Agrobacterium group]|uniref:Gfo/Idh/MocA family protein n=1 Tax=Rhizobium/Agrobacterium group TaxID=227290 RepID=UPI0012E7DA9C|nr:MULTISPECIES: Gfo/Idh/MocA family oxidoreductase [Rhizobium/Agrobacterium group]MCF1473577.1 Gfo/Idh/MocA family oxidoreductase [Allorhizobium ampelinum]MVA51247.1 gfo/Idh/MocA family oxidoreductase [Agrobacterium vitis]NSZ55801.1 Gfo/Idh/MocA family oxidoreductase [Agrobacterium vitis]NTA35052.1 Gfo/Idh/MocA family oxidoreductase [Agrobacterium vitis]
MVRLGLVGLGEVAQLIHLPILQRLTEMFTLAGAYDPSPSVAQSISTRWSIERVFDSVDAMISSPDIDAILIMSPDQYHGGHARAALKAHKHVLIEKPCCLTMEDLAALNDVAEQTDRVAMVGYMRRFAPAFLEAKKRLPAFADITYVRVRDVICEGPWYFRQTDTVVTPNGDIPASLIEESRQLRGTMMDSLLGPNASAELQTAYSVLTGLSSHSLSAMRDLLGSPKRVIAAEIKQGGSQITALFDYGHFTAIYECMIGDVVRFEAGFEINSRYNRLAFEYPTPYIRNLPMVLDVQNSTDDDNSLTRLGPFHQDPFDVELRAFHAAVTQGGENRTPPSESMADLDLFAAIIAAARKTD